LGIDYDIGGMEADERLAEARYEKIREGIHVLKQSGYLAGTHRHDQPADR
jgi:hypothetical protein